MKKGVWKVAGLLVVIMIITSLAAVSAAEDDTNPVVFVHGYTGSENNWDSMIDDLEDEGYVSDELHAITYENPWDASANEDNAHQLSDFIDDVMADTGEDEVDIVAHSMGGLSSRYYLQELDGHVNVGAMITLGTPHDGVLLGPGDLSRYSSFLRSLNRGDVTPGDVHYVSIYGTADMLVTTDSAHMDEWENERVFGVTHMRLLTSSSVFDHVLENLTGDPEDDNGWGWW